ncbi:hypothetical protein BC830DRAFT_673488 [Chytriomyces sp. MP71]|nr:hypothetical protein BC830DRAFT_673488 [Chytriomyces sp. MP71]
MPPSDFAVEFKERLEALEAHIHQFMPFARSAAQMLMGSHSDLPNFKSEPSIHMYPDRESVTSSVSASLEVKSGKQKRDDALRGLALSAPAPSILKEDWLDKPALIPEGDKANEISVYSAELENEGYPRPSTSDRLFEQNEQAEDKSRRRKKSILSNVRSVRGGLSKRDPPNGNGQSKLLVAAPPTNTINYQFDMSNHYRSLSRSMTSLKRPGRSPSIASNCSSIRGQNESGVKPVTTRVAIQHVHKFQRSKSVIETTHMMRNSQKPDTILDLVNVSSFEISLPEEREEPSLASASESISQTPIKHPSVALHGHLEALHEGVDRSKDNVHATLHVTTGSDGIFSESVKSVTMTVGKTPQLPAPQLKLEPIKIQNQNTNHPKIIDILTSGAEKMNEAIRTVRRKLSVRRSLNSSAVSSTDLGPEKKSSPSSKWFESMKGFNSTSKLSIGANFIISLIMFSQLWLIPFALAFNTELPILYSVFVMVANLADCILEFITIKNQHPNMKYIKKPSLRDWQTYYLRHDFTVDLITIFPFELLPLSDAKYFWAIRLLRIHKLPNLLKSSPPYIRFQRDLQRLSGIGHSGALIFPLFIYFCFFLHWEACVIFLTGRLHGFSNSDISHLADGYLGEQYAWALYISVGNTFPMIYRPTQPIEQVTTFSFVILGAAFNASIVGVLSALAMGYDASGRAYKQKIDELQEYMQHKSLAPITRRKILKYYNLKYRGKYFEETALLKDLNDSLRMEIAAHNCRELVRKVPFLNRTQSDGRDELFMGRIASELVPCHYVAGDMVFIQGQLGKDMFFILRGSIHVLVSGKRVAILSEGSFFGEVALIANIPRTATVQVATSAILYRLNRDIFVDICEEFEDVKRRVHGIYLERMEKINQEEEERARRVAQSLAANLEFLQRNTGDGRDDEFLLKLAKGLVVTFLVAGDIVFREGEPGDDIYFIKKGTVEIVAGGRVVNSIGAGMLFGEIALIANTPRTATTRAATTCMLYRLSRITFNKIIQEFDDMRERINRIYLERMEFVRQENLNKVEKLERVRRRSSMNPFKLSNSSVQ